MRMKDGVELTPEARRVYNLTDAEILKMLRQRSDELATARALAGLLEVFLLAKRKGRKAMWISEIEGLIKLYSQNYQPGHECHPFRNFDARFDVRMEAKAPSDEEAAPSLADTDSLKTSRPKKKELEEAGT